MVLFHGLGGDRRQWLDVLPANFPFRTLLPDLPGHGQANWLPPSGCSFTSFVDLAHHWLSTNSGSEPVMLGGISTGAGIAVRLARLLPERVQKLVLVRPAWQTSHSQTIYVCCSDWGWPSVKQYGANTVIL
ncbi:alpha/beta fold hydrolase [Fibrella arboris]|uniref:alpha/beta fold hydrolase n=1 Tax=Fibrella arboris TaxID=3242486 RepID=UPI00351FC9C9